MRTAKSLGLDLCQDTRACLSVGCRADVDAVAARFRVSGLLISDPRKIGDGFYETVVRSPDGTLIEIVE